MDEFIKLSDIDDLASSISRFQHAEYITEEQDEHENLLNEIVNENESSKEQISMEQSQTILESNSS